MKIRANDIDLRDAERFDSFSSVIINCKNYFCLFYNKACDVGAAGPTFAIMRLGNKVA